MAGFGFSVGDFITVGVLAANIYQRCKASVLEFKDLSREVISMQIVLDAIGHFWTEEEARGHNLDIEQKNMLKELAGECEKVLQNISELLDEHRALARGSKMARMRWIPIQINPIRNRLILFTTLLATLNNTITASTYANSQAQVLEALNIIQRDLWEGKRRTSAVSRVTMDELCDDHSEAWQNINAEVESVGVDGSLVTANQQFIRLWIDQVILEEADDDQSYRDIGSPPWPASATPPNEPITAITLELPNKNKADTERTAVDTLAQSAQGSSGVEDPIMTMYKVCWQSFCSQLKPIQWRILLHAKRIFHQLDWRDRGFLYRPTIEDEFRDAIHKAKMVLSDERLVQLVSDGDKNRDGVIDRDEFIELTNELLVLFSKGEDDGLQGSIAKHIDLAIEYCTREVTQIFADKPSQAILPWGWRLSSTEPTTFTFGYGSTTLMTSTTTPQVTLRSFRVAALVADRLCVRMIVQALKTWSGELIKRPPHVFDEYQRPIDDVLKVASRFTGFEARKSSSRLENKLDEVHELVSLVVNVESNGTENEHAINLLEKLRVLRNDTFSLLRLILGFVGALGQLPGSKWRDSPPSIEDWRRMRMYTRANQIREASESLLNLQPLMNEYQAWFDDSSSFAAQAFDGVQRAMSLRAAQADLNSALRNKAQLKQGNRVAITIVSANIPYLPMYRVPSPSAQITIGNGNARPPYERGPAREDTRYPEWNYVTNWHVRPESVISIRIVSTRRASPYQSPGKWLIRKPTEHLIGVCESIRVGDVVSDLSDPSSNEFTRTLKNSYGSIVRITIQPHRPEEIPRTKWTATSIGDLMTSISSLTLLEGWERMETADGRTYFKNMADGKTTVAYNLSVPVETALLIPTASSLEQPQQPDKVSSPTTYKGRFRKRAGPTPSLLPQGA